MYVRQQAISDVERVVEAVNGLTIRAAAMAEAGDYSHAEARAFLDLIEPLESVLLRVREFLSLVDEGEATWRDFLGEHPELG